MLGPVIAYFAWRNIPSPSSGLQSVPARRPRSSALEGQAPFIQQTHSPDGKLLVARGERASFLGPQRFDLSWNLIWETYCFWSSYVLFLSQRQTQRTKLSEGGKASLIDLQGASRSNRCSRKWTPWFLRWHTCKCVSNMPSATLLHATVCAVDPHVVFVVLCLSWDDAGILTSPLAMKAFCWSPPGRSPSNYQAVLSRLPPFFVAEGGRCRQPTGWGVAPPAASRPCPA